MNKRYISVEDIDGRLSDLPRDVRQIIDPMVNREYQRLRNLAETVADRFIHYYLNPAIVNLEVAYDKTFDILAQYIGLNLDEFLYVTRTTPTYVISLNPNDISNLLPVYYLINVFSPSLTVDKVIEDIKYDAITPNSIHNYIISLFKDAGYQGNNLNEFFMDFNRHL